MGLSLRKLGSRITDVFDANSGADQKKRMAAGQARLYADQQRKLGNQRPANNVGQAFLGNAARTFNTLGGVVRETPGTFKAGIGMATHNQTAVNNALDEIKRAQVATRNPNAGLFKAGTIYKNANDTPLAGETAKRFGTSYLAGAGELAPIPATKAIKGANLGVKALKVGLASGVANTAADAGNQYINNGKIDLKRSATAFGTGAVLGTAAPLAWAGTKVAAKGATNALNKGVQNFNLTPLNEVGGINGTKANALRKDNKIIQKKWDNTADVKARKQLSKQITRNNVEIGRLTKLDERGGGSIENSPIRKLLQGEGKAPKAPEPVQSPVVSSPKNTQVPLEVTNKNTIQGEFQRALVDKDAPIINYLKGVEKQTGKTGLVDQFMYDTGLQRRANAVANAKIQSSEHINKAFGGLKGGDKAGFDSYVAARQELSNAKNKMPTSQPVADLKATVRSLSKHEQRFKELNKYYKKWADDLHQAGIIDDATHKSFKANNDYTRVQRVMDDIAGFRGNSGNSYSLGSTLTRLKRKGSERIIQPADTTAFKYGQDVQTEIQRNQTASNLIDVLESMGHAKRVENTTNKNTLSRIVNGKTEIYQVPRDIKEVADNVSAYQLGVLGNIVAAPQRLLRAGATGLSLPFTAANYVKDQVSSAVMSKDAMATHVLHPQNIALGLYQSAKDFGVGADDELWQKFTAHLGDTTQYDFIRNAKNAKMLSREIRTGQGGRLVNKGIHPIRTLEDLNQITEKATRFQNFKGIYEKAIKEGLSDTEATQKATLAAWQNSVDFSRMGHVGQAINLLVPYFNAGVQGTRLLGRRTAQNPVGTITKTAGFVGLPLAAITLYNMEDEQRKKVYDNISDFEKQNNIIVVLPGAKQNQDGSYSGVIKVPLQPGLSNTVQPIRMGIENYAHGNPQDVAAMSKQFFGALAGPVNTNSPTTALGSVTPQVVKPFIQQAANKDLFTGKQIVPDYIENATDANGNPVKESDKAYSYTSGTARAIGKATNTSPIRVEKFIKDASAKVGLYSLNAADNALAKAGAIPKEQIGGISAKEDLARRFTMAQGKYNYNKSEGAKYYDNIKKVTSGLNGNEQAAFNALHPAKKNFLGDTIYTADKAYDPAARLDTYNRYPAVFEADKKLDAQNSIHNPLYSLESWQVKKVLEKENLPPGAKDPELSKLREQDWYNDYTNKKTQMFTDLKNKLATDLTNAVKKGDKAKIKSLTEAQNKFSNQSNPYPDTPPDLQKIMDAYNAMPKGTGARSAWIKANPGQWARMQQQYAAVDNWQNIARGKRGLDATEGDTGIAAGYGDSSSGYGSGSGGNGNSGSSDPYKYAVSLNQGSVGKPKAFKVSKGKTIAKKKIGKIKTKSVKSKV